MDFFIFVIFLAMLTTLVAVVAVLVLFIAILWPKTRHRPRAERVVMLLLFAGLFIILAAVLGA